MLMALAIVPAMALTGAAVDYSTSNKAKAKLDAVADSAALAAVDHTAISGTAAAVDWPVMVVLGMPISPMNRLGLVAV